MVLDPKLLVEIFECVVVKLLSIVKDEDLRDLKAVNDTFPNEVLDIFLHDNGQWFCLDPFGEVVDLYNKELDLPHHPWGRVLLCPILIGRMARGRSLV